MGKKRTGFINLSLPDAGNRLSEDVTRISNSLESIDEEFKNHHLGVTLGDPFLGRYLTKRKNVQEVPQELIVQNTADFKSLVLQSFQDMDTKSAQVMSDIEDLTAEKLLALQQLSISRPNELINSDFQVAQRGASFNFTSTNKYGYTLDRWFFRTNSSVFNFSISKSSNLDISSSVLNNGSVNQFGQFIPFLSKYKGNYISISLKVKCNKAITTSIITKAIINSEEEITINQSNISIGTSFSEIKIENILVNYSNVNQTTDMSSLFIALNLPSDVYTITVEHVKVEVSVVCTPYISSRYKKELDDCNFFYSIQNFLAKSNQYTIYAIPFVNMIKQPNIRIFSNYNMTGTEGKVTNFDVNLLEYTILSIQQVHNIIESLTLQTYASNDSYYKGSMVLDSEIYYFTV